MTQPINSKPSEMPQGPPTKNKSTWAQTAVEVISGGVGGSAGMVAATPFMYFKMHMQEKAKNPQNPPVFEKNPRKWFAGGAGLAAWMFPQTAIAFAMTESFRQQLSNDGERQLSQIEKLACSATTGGFLSLLVTPQELIWAQQKMTDKSAMQIVREIWEKHGIKGFYRAAGETTAREIVSNSVLTCLAQEYPILAPVLGAAISQPLDGRKTNKQTDFTYKAPLRELFRTKAFSGLLVGRIPIYLVFMNVAPYVKDVCQQWALPKDE
jgi:hypothetical protein